MKKGFLFLLLFLFSNAVISQDNFVSTWAIPSDNYSFELPLKDYANITIDWGDSSTSSHTDGAFQTHTYASNGTKTITVAVNDGAKDIGRMLLSGHASGTLIRTITNWGEGKWENFHSAFRGATNLTIPATDEPDLSRGPSMIYAFANCSSLVGGTFNDWITSNVTDMYGMFTSATAFNGDISLWDTSSVIEMGRMFHSASSFNRDINTSGSSWDTSSVTSMYAMFLEATAFDGDISLWDTSNVTGMNQIFRGASAFDEDISLWDTSSLTDMRQMFMYATSFDGDISSWDTSSGVYMAEMFRGPNEAAFNGDISSWDTSSATNMDSMFQENNTFNQNLNGWCVTNISSEPEYFNGWGALTDANQPLWGTCPQGIRITSTTSGVTDGSTTSDATIALTFTTVLETSNFAVGDITSGNGALSSFTAVSGTV